MNLMTANQTPQNGLLTTNKSAPATGPRRILPESGDPEYTAGAVHSQDNFETAYGYFEARCRLPQTAGGWSAFWLHTDAVKTVGDRRGMVIPWSNGNREFSSASSNHKSYKTMRVLAKTDEAVAKRFNYLRLRQQEELFDLKNDPDCLNNLVSNSEYEAHLDHHRNLLTIHMKDSGDFVLEAMKNRNTPEKLEQFMAAQDRQSVERAETVQWKRFRNRVGGTGKNTELFVSPANQ